MKKTLAKYLVGSIAALSVLFSGCAKKPDPTANDPLEGYNRGMFAFNQDVDHLIFKPVATAYSKITPPALQSGITNVFHNVDELSTFGNDFLQGNFRYMVLDFWRFAINTTVGVGGLFDIASRMGIQTHVEGFALTLAKWRGGESSPYFIIPFLGPSSFQGTLGLAADYYMTPFPYVNNQTINYAITGTRLIHTRARYLPADKLIETAFDPYVFVRNAYMQKEKEQIAENQALPPLK